MSKYINNTNLFQTGFLPSNSNELRIKQGLEPQIVNNYCLNETSTNISQNILQTEQHIQRPKQVKWNYRLPEIPDNCPCIQYLF